MTNLAFTMTRYERADDHGEAENFILARQFNRHNVDWGETRLPKHADSLSVCQPVSGLKKGVLKAGVKWGS